MVPVRLGPLEPQRPGADTRLPGGLVAGAGGRGRARPVVGAAGAGHVVGARVRRPQWRDPRSARRLRRGHPHRRRPRRGRSVPHRRQGRRPGSDGLLRHGGGRAGDRSPAPRPPPGGGGSGDWHRTARFNGDLIDAGDVLAHAVHDATHHLMDVGRGLHHLGAPPSGGTGRVAQLSVSGGGVPKLPVARARIGAEGMEGDRQATRRHHGRPWQALCLWSLEVIERLGREGHPIGPGLAGENVTVAGIDWAELRPGVRLRVGEALVETRSGPPVLEESTVVPRRRLPPDGPHPGAGREPRLRLGPRRRRGPHRRPGGGRALTRSGSSAGSSKRPLCARSPRIRGNADTEVFFDRPPGPLRSRGSGSPHRRPRRGSRHEGARLPPQLLPGVDRCADKVGVIDGDVPGDLRRAPRPHPPAGARRWGPSSASAASDRFAVMATNSHEYLELYHAALPRRRHHQPPQPAPRPQGAGLHPGRLGDQGLLRRRPVRAPPSSHPAPRPGLDKVVLIGPDARRAPRPHLQGPIARRARPRSPTSPRRTTPSCSCTPGGTTGLPKGVLLDQRAEILNLYHVAMRSVSTSRACTSTRRRCSMPPRWPGCWGCRRAAACRCSSPCSTPARCSS